jgi:hypothetical protein
VEQLLFMNHDIHAEGGYLPYDQALLHFYSTHLKPLASSISCP